MNHELPDVQAGFRKAEEPEIKLPTSDGSYTVDVTNRFKGLDLTDRVPEELWMEVHDIVQKQ